MKNTGAPMGDLDGQMQPFARFSQRKLSSSFCSAGDRGNVWEQGSSVPSERSMVWSHAFVTTSSPRDRKALRGWQTWAQPLGWPLSHWVCWVVSEMVQGYHS